MERRRLWNARSAIGTTWNYLELFGTPQVSSLLLSAFPLTLKCVNFVNFVNFL